MFITFTNLNINNLQKDVLIEVDNLDYNDLNNPEMGL